LTINFIFARRKPAKRIFYCPLPPSPLRGEGKGEGKKGGEIRRKGFGFLADG
jgi:hypothetical protein